MIYTHRQFVRAQRQLDRLHTIKRYNFPPEKVLAKYGVSALDESISLLESELDRRRNWLNGTTRIDLSTMDEVPEQLIMARIYCGISQQELAQRIGTTRQQINRLERTLYRTASWRVLMKVKEVLDEPVKEKQDILFIYEERNRKRFAERMKSKTLENNSIENNSIENKSIENKVL